jgi:hypothetical protein
MPREFAIPPVTRIHNVLHREIRKFMNSGTFMPDIAHLDFPRLGVTKQYLAGEVPDWEITRPETLWDNTIHSIRHLVNHAEMTDGYVYIEVDVLENGFYRNDEERIGRSLETAVCVVVWPALLVMQPDGKYRKVDRPDLDPMGMADVFALIGANLLMPTPEEEDLPPMERPPIFDTVTGRII